MRPNNYKTIFVRDGGALLEIIVLGSTPSDWETFLEYLAGQHEISYEEDGVPKPLPQFDMIIERSAEAAVTLKVHFPGFTVNCHFFDLDRIEMDVPPENVDSTSKAELVFKLMSDVARVLGKPVILIPESSERSPAMLLKSALCSAAPTTGEITMRN